MKLYPKYPAPISALAFSPDGTKLAIGASYEHDNAVTKPEEQAIVMVLIKNTVMDDCKVCPKRRILSPNTDDFHIAQGQGVRDELHGKHLCSLRTHARKK